MNRARAFANAAGVAKPRTHGPAKRPVAVIGAGFSGTIAALQLLRNLPPDQPVLLCERAPEFGRGVAYASFNHDHLLNVRAANMSALTDEPNHFAAWLGERARFGPQAVHPTAAGLFASRGLFGEYLQALLDVAVREAADHARLRLMPDDATDIELLPDGGYSIGFAGGMSISVAGIVLAVGNLLPEEHPDPHICANPWGEKTARPLNGDLPVLISGTGLTMVDLAISMRRRGFKGRIVAMSRGGLLPARHEAADPWPAPRLAPAELNSLTQLMRRVRGEVRAAAAHGVDWRGVIDSVRPFTAQIWAGLPLEERRRFLRHARRYWDVHRHRMAPPHATAISAMLRDRSLQVIGGRIDRLEPRGNLVNVVYRLRGAANEQAMQVQRVIMASGLNTIERTRDPLLGRLIETGLARFDKHGMGLDVTESLRVVRADGKVADRIWALGPIVRGVFWECVAVPDIRLQAAQLAANVAAGLDTPASQRRGVA